MATHFNNCCNCTYNNCSTSNCGAGIATSIFLTFFIVGGLSIASHAIIVYWWIYKPRKNTQRSRTAEDDVSSENPVTSTTTRLSSAAITTRDVKTSNRVGGINQEECSLDGLQHSFPGAVLDLKQNEAYSFHFSGSVVPGMKQNELFGNSLAKTAPQIKQNRAYGICIPKSAPAMKLNDNPATSSNPPKVLPKKK